jgi:hypothetical protein
LIDGLIKSNAPSYYVSRIQGQRATLGVPICQVQPLALKKANKSDSEKAAKEGKILTKMIIWEDKD